REFVGVFLEDLSRCPHRFSDPLFGDAAAPFFHDTFPGYSGGYLLQHVCHENPRASKGGLPMANFGICNDVTPHHFLSHIRHEYVVPAKQSTHPIYEVCQRPRTTKDQARFEQALNPPLDPALSPANGRFSTKCRIKCGTATRRSGRPHPDT